MIMILFFFFFICHDSGTADKAYSPPLINPEKVMVSHLLDLLHCFLRSYSYRVKRGMREW